MITFNNLYQKIELICERIMDQIDKGLDVFFKYFLLFLKSGFWDILFVWGWLLYFRHILVFCYRIYADPQYIPIKFESNIYIFTLVNIVSFILYAFIAYHLYRMYFFNNPSPTKKIFVFIFSFMLAFFSSYIENLDSEIMEVFPQIPIERNAFWYGR